MAGSGRRAAAAQGLSGADCASFATGTESCSFFDEVITGFGRLGAPFAAQRFGVTPDLMTTAKGLTNGVLPMGAVFARRAVHDVLMQGPPAAIEFFHGYTYSGHPTACAAALATLDIYRREGLLTRVAGRVEETWADAIYALRGARHVIDIRNIGLMGAVELEPPAGRAGCAGLRGAGRSAEAGPSGARHRRHHRALTASDRLRG